MLTPLFCCPGTFWMQGAAVAVLRQGLDWLDYLADLLNVPASQRPSTDSPHPSSSWVGLRHEFVVWTVSGLSNKPKLRTTLQHTKSVKLGHDSKGHLGPLLHKTPKASIRI
jgi:hypothetical protein